MGEGWQGARQEGAWGPGRGAPTVPVPVPGLPHRGCLSPGLSLIPLERGVGGGLKPLPGPGSKASRKDWLLG